MNSIVTQGPEVHLFQHSKSQKNVTAPSTVIYGRSIKGTLSVMLKIANSTNGPTIRNI